MSTQRTLALVKPDAFAAGHSGKIVDKILAADLQVVAVKTLHLTPAQAEGFYHVHKERPFFGDLCKFMCEGKLLAMVLSGEDAIKRWRDLMGPTNASDAPAGTIRGDFGTSIERNASHGSDAPDTAAFETGYFFSGIELV